MPEEPRKYHLNFSASNELEEQAHRAKLILERIAAHLAATGQVGSDLVEERHVAQAADLLFGQERQVVSDSAGHCVFLSYSHEDEAFVDSLAKKLDAVEVSYFKADRDIQVAADWSESIWTAIRSCQVFLSVLTPRFLKSRWRDLEGGAAIASNKQVLTALRYVDRNKLKPPFDRFQSVVVESPAAIDELVAELRRLCAAGN